MRAWQKPPKLTTLVLSLAALAACGLAPGAAADGRLAWTGGVTEIEGAAGGGLVPWALITGLGTADEIGGSAFASGASTPRFDFRAAGVALGIDDRLELSYARQWFGIGQVVPGVTLGQDVVGAKLKLAGDAVFDQDRWWPQLSAGAIYKRTRDFESVPAALGAHAGTSTDFYLAATKVFLGGLAGRNVLLDVTVRRSDANQLGLLGFGGTRGEQWQPEGSAAIWLTDSVLLGLEYRRKFGGLATPVEGSARDVFAAWEPWRNLTIVAAFVDLGPVAFQQPQRGGYLSVVYSR